MLRSLIFNVFEPHMGSPSCSYGMELYLDHGSHFEEVMNADDDDGGD